MVKLVSNKSIRNKSLKSGYSPIDEPYEGDSISNVLDYYGSKLTSGDIGSITEVSRKLGRLFDLNNVHTEVEGADESLSILIPIRRLGIDTEEISSYIEDVGYSVKQFSEGELVFKVNSLKFYYYDSDDSEVGRPALLVEPDLV